MVKHEASTGYCLTNLPELWTTYSFVTEAVYQLFETASCSP
jgi:hypothetical protein